MYNLRYHIASLVAVFLSLSIGLLLGTIVVERGTLDRQKEAIVQSLQEEFRSLDAANSELRERAASREDLVDTLLPVATGGRLAERHVLIIAATGRADGLGAAQEAVREAGGTPVTMVLSSAGFGLSSPEVSSVVTQTVEPVPVEDLRAAVVADLVREWSTPAAERTLTALLAEAGVLRIDGEPEVGVAVAGVVTLAAFPDGPDAAALELARGLADAGLPALGGEARSQSTGVVDAAVDVGLSAVDHLGSPEGTYSLVLVLAGQAEGYFGYGDNAVSPWPR